MLMRRNCTDGLPPSIEIELISRLYESVTQFLCIAACLILGASIMAIRTGDPVLWGIVAAAVVTVSGRIRRRCQAQVSAVTASGSTASATPVVSATPRSAKATVRTGAQLRQPASVKQRLCSAVQSVVWETAPAASQLSAVFPSQRT